MKVIISLVQPLGQLAACEPAARLVRRLHPGAELYWVTARPLAPLVRFQPQVDAVHEVACLCEWDRLQHVVDGVVYDLNFAGQACARCGTPWTRRAPAHGVDASNWRRHGPLLPAALKTAGLPEVSDQPQFWRQRSGLVVPGWLGRRMVAIQTRPADPSRAWHLPAWAALCGWLQQQGFGVVEVGAQASGIPGVLHAGSADAQQAALAIDMADIFIGLDADFSHVANALQKPSVILLGQSGPDGRYVPFTGDFHARSAVVRPAANAADPALAALPVDAVIAALRGLKAFAEAGGHV